MMISLAFSVAAALMQAAAPAPAAPSPSAPAAGPWILTCDVGGATAPGGEGGRRVFRLAPRQLQEWSPTMKSFGPNLCEIFACRTDPQRLEGVITSASVALTIAANPAARTASWSTQGATNLGRASGPCTMEPERAPVNAAGR